MTIEQLGYIPPPPLPTNVTGELDLTQGFGPVDNGTAATRGYVPVPSGTPYFSNASQVSVCSAHKSDSCPLPCKKRLPLLPAIQYVHPALVAKMLSQACWPGRAVHALGGESFMSWQELAVSADLAFCAWMTLEHQSGLDTSCLPCRWRWPPH